MEVRFFKFGPKHGPFFFSSLSLCRLQKFELNGEPYLEEVLI